MVGRIEILNVRKFGFIVAEDKKYFFHNSALHDVVFDGHLLGKYVTFDPVEGERGPVAENVRPQ
jgi:cold shock CspA family protein